MEIIKQKLTGNDIVHVLHNRPFLLLMLSEFFSQIAFNMQHFVIIFVMYELTKSNTAVSGIILSFTIPQIIFSIIAGVYVDRFRKKNILFLTNLIRGFLLLLFLIPGLHPFFMFVFTFLIAVCTQFFLPAESAVIPLLVEKKLLLPANAVFSIGIYSTILIGYVFSGPFLLWGGKDLTFIFLGILFFISTIFIAFIPSREQKVKVDTLDVKKSLQKEVRYTFAFIKQKKQIMYALMIVTLSQSILFIFAVLGPGYVSEILGVAVEQLSLIILAPAATGMVLGALILGSIGKRFTTKKLVSIGFLITGCVFLFFPYGSKLLTNAVFQTINAFLPSLLDITVFHTVIGMAFLAGMANSLIFVPSNAAIQRHAEEEIRGRVYGILNSMVGAVSLLPVAIAGGLADIFGVATVITGIGIFIIALGLYSFYYNKI